MNNEKFEFDQVREWAIKEVRRTGRDFVYFGAAGTCKYTRHDLNDSFESVNVPGCIVGHMLINNAGVSVEEMIELDLRQETDIQSIRPYLSVKFTEKAARFMSVLQTYQDSQLTWGYALDGALEETDPKDFDLNEDAIDPYVRVYGRDSN